MYSSQKIYINGWFVYNGLWNNGKATFVGPKPLFLEKESLCHLMFEKVATQHTNCTNGVTFQRLKTLNDNQVIKGLIAVITVEPSINYSFVLTDMQPRLMGQNNEKMTLSPRLHVKPLVTVITAIEDPKNLLMLKSS